MRRLRLLLLLTIVSPSDAASVPSVASLDEERHVTTLQDACPMMMEHFDCAATAAGGADLAERSRSWLASMGDPDGTVQSTFESSAGREVALRGDSITQQVFIALACSLRSMWQDDGQVVWGKEGSKEKSLVNAKVRLQNGGILSFSYMSQDNLADGELLAEASSLRPQDVLVWSPGVHARTTDEFAGKLRMIQDQVDALTEDRPFTIYLPTTTIHDLDPSSRSVPQAPLMSHLACSTRPKFTRLRCTSAAARAKRGRKTGLRRSRATCSPMPSCRRGQTPTWASYTLG